MCVQQVPLHTELLPLPQGEILLKQVRSHVSMERVGWKPGVHTGIPIACVSVETFWAGFTSALHCWIQEALPS